MKNQIRWDVEHSLLFWIGFGFRSILEGFDTIFSSLLNPYVSARYITHKEEDEDKNED